MHRIFLFPLLILLSTACAAEVFKCKTQEGVVYSEHPCAENASVMKNQNTSPSAADARAARNRAANDQRQVEENSRKEMAERQAREAAEPRVVSIIVTRHTRAAQQ
jgi:hypothetical protein